MTDPKAGPSRISLHTDQFPPERRLAAFRESYATSVLPCQIDPLDDGPFWSSLESVRYGDAILAAVAGSPMRCATEREDTEGGEPGLMIDLLYAGNYSLRQGGRAAMLNAGDGVLIHSQMPFLAISPVAISTRSVVLPEVVLKGAFGDLERLAGLVLDRDTTEMRILATYLGSVDLIGPVDEPQLKSMIGRHVTELVLSAIARSLRKEDPTEGRGIRAARLAEVRRLIEENLGQSTLNAVRVARQLGVTERYVQKLVEESGTTFSAYVMEKRLQRARQILAEDLQPDMTVRDIAFSLGFSEPSHFTRAFRQRFGETPTSVRGSEAAGREERAWTRE